MVKKILITGAGGFIGSHLAERCVEEGSDVRCFLHYNSRNFHGWLEDSPRYADFEIVTGDIRDYDSVLAAMRGCAEVYHLAALIGIPYSYISPAAYIRTNVIGTYNVLEAAKTLGTGMILVTSTSETYGTAQYVPMNETHPSVGQSPYAATKIAADQLAMSYFHSFSLPVRLARPFNTYGPRQSARAVIPSVIIQLLAGRREVHVGNLHPTRDLTYVADTVDGFLKIARADALNGTVTNIGTGRETAIRQVAEQIAELMEAEIRFDSDAGRIRPEQSEVERLVCDNSRLTTHTDWRPAFDLRAGLTRTIEWFSRHRELYKPGIYNV